MMKCKDARNRFPDVADGVLKQEAQTEFTNHIKQCASCGKALDDYKNALLTLHNAPLFEPENKYFYRIKEKLEKQPATEAAKIVFSNGLRRFAYAAAFCAVLILVFLGGYSIRKEKFEKQTQVVAYLMEQQTTELTLQSADVKLPVYDELLGEEKLQENSWDNALTALGL